MKAKSYKMKYTPTEEELIKNGFRDGGSWILKDAVKFKSRIFMWKDCEFSIEIAFKQDKSDFDDFENVLVMDEDFGQPYTPFYGDNYKKNITNFPALEFVIEKYNDFMDSFDFLEEAE